MKISMKSMLVSATFTILAGGALAQADTFPSKPIQLIVPYAAGGATDLIARLLGKAVSESLGQQVVVENKGGGATIIGTETVVRAKPDGHTILLVTAPVVTNEGLFSKLPYDVNRDLSPLILLSAQGFVLAVNAKQPYKTLAELVTAARKPDSNLAYASPGLGTHQHLAGQVMNAKYQTNFIHVPYKSSGPALQDVIAGQVPMIFVPVTIALPAIEKGLLRPLVVTDPDRLPALPDVPTMRELGYPNAEAVSFSGLMVPAGTPSAVVNKLNAAFNRALNLPETKKILIDQLGGTIAGGSAEEFGTFLKDQMGRWVPLIKQLGLKSD